MPRKSCAQVHLPAIQAEQPGLDPLTLIIHKPNELNRSRSGQVLNGKPRGHGQRGHEDHSANGLTGQRLVRRRTDGQLVATPQIDGGNELQVHRKLHKRFSRPYVMVDGPGGEPQIKASVFDRVQVGDADGVGVSGAVPGQKSAQVLSVVIAGIASPLPDLLAKELLSDVDDAEPIGVGAGGGAGFVPPPLLPAQQLSRVPAECLSVVAPEVALAAPPLHHVATVGQLGEGGGFHGHGGPQCTARAGEVKG